MQSKGEPWPSLEDKGEEHYFIEETGNLEGLL